MNDIIEAPQIAAVRPDRSFGSAFLKIEDREAWVSSIDEVYRVICWQATSSTGRALVRNGNVMFSCDCHVR